MDIFLLCLHNSGTTNAEILPLWGKGGDAMNCSLLVSCEPTVNELLKHIHVYAIWYIKLKKKSHHRLAMRYQIAYIVIKCITFICVKFALLLHSRQKVHSSNVSQPFYMLILWEWLREQSVKHLQPQATCFPYLYIIHVLMYVKALPMS